MESEAQQDRIFMEEPPWLNPPENYSIAITGKAFNFLVENVSSHRAILQ
ncbi:MAG: hypothetical protein ACMG6E_07190 [Candidatus Roizmanbacteria bacterium]